MGSERIKNGSGVLVTLSPTRAELKAIVTKARKGLNSKKPYQKVAALLDRWVQKNFQSEGKKATSGGWVKFSEFNIRKIKDSKAKLLQDKGRLRSSFVPFYSLFNAGIGSKLDYAEQHEKGEGDVPKRKMLPVKKQVWPDIKKTLNLHTMDTLKKAFKKTRKVGR